MDGLDGYIRVGWGIEHLVVQKFFRVQETEKSNRNTLRESWMCATWLLNGSLSTTGHLCDFIKQGATHLGIFSNHESRKGKVNAVHFTPVIIFFSPSSISQHRHPSINEIIDASAYVCNFIKRGATTKEYFTTWNKIYAKVTWCLEKRRQKWNWLWDQSDRFK